MSSAIKQAPISCPGHTRPVVDIYFSVETDCGTLFITAAKDCKAILRRGDTGDWIGTFLGHEGAVWSCVLDAHATKAATGAADFTAKLWDTVSGHQLLSITEEHVVRCTDLSKTDSGAFLATANNAKKISVYDLIAPTKPLIQLQAHDEFLRRTLWCDGDRHLLTASEDATIKLWDLKDRKKNPVIETPCWSRSCSLAVKDFQFHHPNDEHTGETLAAVAAGAAVHLYLYDWRNTSASPDPIESFNLPCNMNSVSIHPTDNTLVCGGEDHYIYRVDRTTGEILETCKGHFGPVHCVRFSPDGHVFTSGSEDGTVRLWQTEPGQKYGLWDLSVPTGNMERSSGCVTGEGSTPVSCPS
ncbi:serine-threonine kinase receptor-associated protein [Clonorchis sinensis]|uniref:Serine-threonine kinase receptor-associated protein n=1 Tax=Clonorchis sinensis TaxID=79923 RepID=H2KQC4_CLOSI|nr:serine-threonine kinase receptor-associated protein [Clonorchis sinensis]